MVLVESLVRLISQKRLENLEILVITRKSQKSLPKSELTPHRQKANKDFH